MDRLVIIATVIGDFREVIDSGPKPKLSLEMNQAPPLLGKFQGELSSNHPPRDMDHPSSSRQQKLGGDATHKDKGIQVEDNAGGGQQTETGSERIWLVSNHGGEAINRGHLDVACQVTCRVLSSILLIFILLWLILSLESNSGSKFRFS